MEATSFNDLVQSQTGTTLLTKPKSLFDLVGEIREKTNWYRFKSDYIIDFATQRLGRFLARNKVRFVCEIILEDLNPVDSMDDAIEVALQQYYRNQSNKRK